MPKKINKSIYMISIDNIYYECYHSRLYKKNMKPAFAIKEYSIENESDNALFIEDEGWTSKEKFGYLGANGNMLLESFNPDDLSKIITKFEKYLFHSLDLCLNTTDWELRSYFNKKILTDFGLTRKDLIKILYNLTTIETINDLKEVSDRIWVKYLL